MTLQAREAFQQGDMWTLRQWLWACRGRSATDPRDLVFAGLSLIKPGMLTIDSNLCIVESAPLETAAERVFPRRHYYPQTIPPLRMKNASRSLHTEMANSTTELSSLLPKGLWPTLKADYTVDPAEVLVNTAACLLTHTGTRELLSIAARTSRPNAYTSEWWVSPGDNLVVEDLPSWAPAPGSWTVCAVLSFIVKLFITMQSRVNEILAFQPGSQFRAGLEAKDSTRISNDGSALFVDASQFDAIDKFILEEDFIDELDFPKLTQLLSNILSLQSMQHRHSLSLFGTLSRVLLGGKEQDSPELFLVASRWLCQTLSYAVWNQVALKRRQQFGASPRRFQYPDMTNELFIEWLDEHHGQARKDADDLLDLFTKVQTFYSDQEWPEWSFPPYFDMGLHTGWLKGLAKEPAPAEGPMPQSTLQTSQDLQGQNSTRHNDKKAKQDKILGPEFEPHDLESHTRFTAVAKSALAWRKVFVTRQGHLGLGPSWLTTKNVVILVRGAHVPYAFTPLEVDLGRRERDIRAAIDKNQTKYNTTIVNLEGMKKKSIRKPLHTLVNNRREGRLHNLNEEYMQLQQKLFNIERSKYRRNALVLQGEVYIEGIMHGQAIKSDTAWERTTIV